MSDLTKYVEARGARDFEFAANLEAGYKDFKICSLLRQRKEGQVNPRAIT